MNEQFRAPDDTGYLLDEVKQLLGDRADPAMTDNTMVYRPGAKNAPEQELPQPKEPPEEAFELDIQYEADEPEEAPAEKTGRSVKAYNSDYVTQNRPPKTAQAPSQPVMAYQAPVQTHQAPVQQTFRVPTQRVQTPAHKVQRDSRPPKSEPPQKRSKTMHDEPKQKKKHPVLTALLVLLLVLALSFTALWLFFPKRPDTTQMKKGDVATILVAGTDKDGTRTDTMLLLYIDKDAGQINLLSLPRDLLTYVDGNAMKLNAVYGYGGGGEAGMELLMDEMTDRIGFRPDGYVLFDFEAVEKLIDRMGGIDFNVPCDMDYEDPAQSLSIHLKEGRQHLSGEEALWVLRYRSGYALADLKRVEVQRDLVKAALDQWCSVWKLPRGMFALLGLKNGTTTDLSARNLAWAAKSVKTVGLSSTQLATMPGEWNSPYYYPAPQSGADLLNGYFNPTTRTITAEDVGY